MEAKTFDYVVVGGGAAGPVAARRLAENFPNKTVVLIEAGPSHTDIFHSTTPMAWEGLHHTDWDWRYTSQPMPQANNRQIHLPRGKFLGGSSGMNGTLMLRGVRQDYDRLARAGLRGWSWNDVLPLFMKSETFHPSDTIKGNPKVHGTTGHLHTSPHPLAPISELIVESFKETGLPWKEDMFSEGEAEGIGHVPRTVNNGTRTSGADFVSGDDVPSNLTVMLSHQCQKVITEKAADGSLRATGVELRINASGFPLVVHAKEEVILSAGAYNSPQLLLLSGVGDKKQLDAFGIPIVKELNGVGQNLQDHIIVFNFMTVTKPQLTNDYQLYGEGAFDKVLGQYLTDKTGVLGRFPFGAFVFKRFDEELKDDPEWKAAKEAAKGEDPMGAVDGTPHVEYFYTECYGGGPQHVHQPEAGKSAFALITLLFNPQARGSVTLTSRNALFPPRIDHAYLSHPLDLLMLAEGCKFGANVVQKGKATADVIDGPWPASRTMPSSQEEWKEYVRQQAGTCYHPAGTCAMGTSPEPTKALPYGAVVDDELRVFGFSNLRVADVSILPFVNSGHTQAPAYMIGEKVAEIIKQQYGVKQNGLKTNGATANGEVSAQL